MYITTRHRFRNVVVALCATVALMAFGGSASAVTITQPISIAASASTSVPLMDNTGQCVVASPFSNSMLVPLGAASALVPQASSTAMDKANQTNSFKTNDYAQKNDVNFVGTSETTAMVRGFNDSSIKAPVNFGDTSPLAQIQPQVNNGMKTNELTNEQALKITPTQPALIADDLKMGSGLSFLWHKAVSHVKLMFTSAEMFPITKTTQAPQAARPMTWAISAATWSNGFDTL